MRCQLLKSARLSTTVLAGTLWMEVCIVMPLKCAERNVGTVLSCAGSTLARPLRGVAYTGLVTNSDYRFSTQLPEGLTGWGAAPNAPFHGFALFLHEAGTPERSSCVVFEIHLRIMLPEDEPDLRTFSTRPTPVKVGNRTGQQITRMGKVDGIELFNRTVMLELPRDSYTDDVSLTLVAPERGRSKAEQTFWTFLESFRFW